MTLLAAIPPPSAAGQLALGLLLGVAGFFLLLPKPRGRSVAGGTAAVLAAAAVLGAWAYQRFGRPTSDWVGTALFVLFSAGAVGFGTVLVVQRNPARGAIAFAFVILSTCGLFLLLAAPFLMAVTIIIYAGAIIVTFLFVLMLSAADGPSDENDRTREPLLGSLAGFAFAGLILFCLAQSRAVAVPADPASNTPPAPLPAPVLTADEQLTLAEVARKLDAVEAEGFYGDPAVAGTTRLERMTLLTGIDRALEDVVGKQQGSIRTGSIDGRLAGYRSDPQAAAVLLRVAEVRKRADVAIGKAEATINNDPGKESPAAVRAAVRDLREQVVLLHGAAELPARNVGNLGLLLYADHLLAVELAGTILLVATIGAVAIVHRKGAPR